MAKCPECNKKMEEVEYVEDLGDIYWCKNCEKCFFYDEDDDDWCVYEPYED